MRIANTCATIAPSHNKTANNRNCVAYPLASSVGFQTF
ncbi:hypothetical protein FCR2A7T_10810 [Flavobacterium cauense R2A-7]|nr:hypothetical protein FCR2A7T_10810 [Flavobacterium cauense R2A-7]